MSARVRNLDSPPNVVAMYGRAALGLVPGAARVLPFVGGNGREIPNLELQLSEVRTDADHLARYREVCGFSSGRSLPATYVHVLAFPLQMALITDGQFPFPAIGLVHISNRITQHRPIDPSETLSMRVSVGALEPHPKGKQFDLITEVRAADELVWEGRSTTLRRGRGTEERSVRKETPDRPASTDVWELKSDLGRRYAAVSGDRNPIHLTDLTAKAFGFPRAIIHGMWTKARCLAALEDQAPGFFTVEVDFKRPILLPASVGFGAAGPAGTATRFAVCDAADGTPHLDGTLTPL